MIVFNTATFADGPGVLVTLLSAGPQLKEIVLLQTEQAVPVDVDHLKDVRQHLPVAKMGNYNRMSARDCANLSLLKLITDIKGFFNQIKTAITQQ